MPDFSDFDVQPVLKDINLGWWAEQDLSLPDRMFELAVIDTAFRFRISNTQRLLNQEFSNGSLASFWFGRWDHIIHVMRGRYSCREWLFCGPGVQPKPSLPGPLPAGFCLDHFHFGLAVSQAIAPPSAECPPSVERLLQNKAERFRNIKLPEVDEATLFREVLERSPDNLFSRQLIQAVVGVERAFSLIGRSSLRLKGFIAISPEAAVNMLEAMTPEHRKITLDEVLP